MIVARIVRLALLVPVVVGAAGLILLSSETAQAADQPVASTTDQVAAAHQTTEGLSITDLVSDHLYRSLLAYKAHAAPDLFPATSPTAPLSPRSSRTDSPLSPGLPIAQNGAGTFGAAGIFSLTAGTFSLHEGPPPPALSPVGMGASMEPDSGGGGQRSRKGTLAPGTSPMTPGDKFNYFLRKSFMPPWPYALAILGGVVSQAIDTQDKKHRENAGEFMVGSMEHAARSFAFRTTANFFEKFAYASLFKQDPRYHPSENTGFGSRLGYAVSRVFVTQGDHGGSQFNASFILGGLTTAGISNLWEQQKHVNAQDTFKRWGTHIGLTALTNVLHELFRR